MILLHSSVTASPMLLNLFLFASSTNGEYKKTFTIGYAKKIHPTEKKTLLKMKKSAGDTTINPVFAANTTKHNAQKHMLTLVSVNSQRLAALLQQLQLGSVDLSQADVLGLHLQSALRLQEKVDSKGASAERKSVKTLLACKMGQGLSVGPRKCLRGGNEQQDALIIICHFESLLNTITN